MSKIESGSEFASRLGVVMTEWADAHPQADKPIMEFIGVNSSGSLAKSRAMTPRQYAKEILEQTDFGIARTNFYLGISENLGDPTGERIIADFTELTEKFRR